mmetsp:Transcript_53296/g.79619  ORF Transcript_53296/g.79619 Transcript_53296/m.79619 type:complete len:115 (-) Transcript_53296:1573-1917(-)
MHLLYKLQHTHKPNNAMNTKERLKKKKKTHSTPMYMGEISCFLSQSEFFIYVNSFLTKNVSCLAGSIKSHVIKTPITQESRHTENVKETLMALSLVKQKLPRSAPNLPMPALTP